MTSEERRKAEGWELAHMFRMAPASAQLDDSEMIFWRSPDGRVVTEAKALEEIEEDEAA